MEGYPVDILYQGRYVSSSNSLPTNITHFAPTQTDAFGRLRMSVPITLFDSYHRFQDNGKISESIGGTGTSVFNSNAGCIELTVGTGSNNYIYRESSRVFSYQPGKSLLVLQSFCFHPPQDGLLQRIGYFDTSNGVFLQQSSSNLSFVIRSSTSGSVLENVVPRDQWNYDTLYGTGPSELTLDITRAQIAFIDMEWLGVGTVRTGFIIDGRYILCHRFHHANRSGIPNIDTTKPYMTTACLPVRAEIRTTQITASPSIMRIICSTVMSEGGYELRGRPRGIGSTLLDLPKNLPDKNTFYPVVAIRLKATRLNAIVVPTQIHLVGVTSANYRWALFQRATVTGGDVWLSAGNDSSVEYKLDGTNGITDGILLKNGFFASTNQASSLVNMDNNVFLYQLERNTFTGEAFTFVLAVAASGPNNNVLAGIDWEELT